MTAKKKPANDSRETLEPTAGDTGAKTPKTPSKRKVTGGSVEQVVHEVASHYAKGEPSLIMILQEIQDVLNWLPPSALKVVARELELPVAKVQGVATFYKAFSLEPRGEKLIKVCLGTACHVRGAGMLVEELERDLKVKAGKGITEDGNFSMETVNCVGACAMAPAVVVGENYYANMTPGDLSAMLKKERS
ncbi:MAG: NAD(P)H-dependent oxidoreductase subunit E [bacterium]